MNFELFTHSLLNNHPPKGLSKHLEALWYDAKDDWEKAHTIIQNIDDGAAAWIHAYLHRKEGDIWNADYWYSRAGKSRPSVHLEKEWEAIAKELMSR